LHVARADLHYVGVLRDQVDVAIAHDFGDDTETSRDFCFLQKLEAVFLHALEIVGRSARLECAAAEHFCTGFGDTFGGLHDLLFRFDGARTGHDDEFVASDFGAVDADARASRFELFADEFIRR